MSEARCELVAEGADWGPAATNPESTRGGLQQPMTPGSPRLNVHRGNLMSNLLDHRLPEGLARPQ